jgi:hypothetical protein
VSTDVRKQQGRFVGQCRIKQADFGIQPVRTAPRQSDKVMAEPKKTEAVVAPVKKPAESRRRR